MDTYEMIPLADESISGLNAFQVNAYEEVCANFTLPELFRQWNSLTQANKNHLHHG